MPVLRGTSNTSLSVSPAQCRGDPAKCGWPLNSNWEGANVSGWGDYAFAMSYCSCGGRRCLNGELFLSRLWLTRNRELGTGTIVLCDMILLYHALVFKELVPDYYLWSAGWELKVSVSHSDAAGPRQAMHETTQSRCLPLLARTLSSITHKHRGTIVCRGVHGRAPLALGVHSCDVSMSPFDAFITLLNPNHTNLII